MANSIFKFKVVIGIAVLVALVATGYFSYQYFWGRSLVDWGDEARAAFAGYGLSKIRVTYLPPEVELNPWNAVVHPNSPQVTFKFPYKGKTTFLVVTKEQPFEMLEDETIKETETGDGMTIWNAQKKVHGLYVFVSSVASKDIVLKIIHGIR